jgi:endoglucanase
MYKTAEFAPERPGRLLEGTELVRELSLAFGPSGSERAVTDLIAGQLYGTAERLSRDRAGNLFALYPSAAKNAPTVMICAHTDEVGFMIDDISSDGFLRFRSLGGMDPRVLCGRHVVFMGAGGPVRGVIGAKPVHLQSADERQKATKENDMYVDIGAASAEDAGRCVAVGDSGTFVSDFVLFGEGGGLMKCKALDDRLGCAAMIETLRRLVRGRRRPKANLVFAFTSREEIGNSGAVMAANRFLPDYGIVLETTAIADLPDVPENSRVADVGRGGVISIADRGTIYDAEFTRGALALAAKKGIPAQVKRYVSGGNDSRNIQRSGTGARDLVISAATRYLHSASCVASVADYASIRELLFAILTEYDFKRKEASGAGSVR